MLTSAILLSASWQYRWKITSSNKIQLPSYTKPCPFLQSMWNWCFLGGVFSTRFALAAFVFQLHALFFEGDYKPLVLRSHIFTFTPCRWIENLSIGLIRPLCSKEALLWSKERHYIWGSLCIPYSLVPRPFSLQPGHFLAPGLRFETTNQITHRWCNA